MKMIPDELIQRDSGLGDWAILTGYRGSVTHGTYVENSICDIDAISVCVPNLDYFFGLKQYGSRGTREIAEGEWDIVIYEIRKYMSMLQKGNPNVLSLLWLEPEHYLKITPAGQLLIDNREAFIGKHLFNTFYGYAYSQLNSMTGRSEKRYKTAYMGARRKALVEEHGYDTKNAAHLVRLMRMGAEVLETGHLQVMRPDAEELKAIKSGSMTIDEVVETVEAGLRDMKRIHKNSTLPDKPNPTTVNALCLSAVSLHLS